MKLSKEKSLNIFLAKISLFLITVIIFISCNAVKNVPEDEFLLTENTIITDSVKTTETGINSQIVQKPNTSIPLINFPVGLNIYNLADQQADSTYINWLNRKPNREEKLIRFISKKQVDEIGNSYIGLNNWLMRSGEAPVIIRKDKTEKSLDRIKRYYSSFGYFNTVADYKIIPDSSRSKRAQIIYNVTRNEPYIVDSIQEKISSPIIDSLFQRTKNQSFIKSGKQYAANDFVNERDRLSTEFRNSGIFYFEKDYITFEGDTVNTNHKANFTYIIPDRKIEGTDSINTTPFQIHKIKEVRIITDFSYANRDKKFQDSITYNGYKLFSYGKMRYRPKAITDAVAVTPGKIFKDVDRSLSYNGISDLKIFKYPNINFQEDFADTTNTDLISTILLTPQKRFTAGANFDTYTSTIQQFGIGFSGNLLIRNVFRGAEILQISGRGSVGSSKDAADSDSQFFNISEIGGDLKLTFPRILFPINTENIIPKFMSPTTNISFGASAQNNIGLDRQTTNAAFSYTWKPRKILQYQLDLLNVQYVRNLNVDNYFRVFQNSFDQLNTIAQDTESTNPGSIDPTYYTLDENNELFLNIPSGANMFITDVRDGVIMPNSDNTNTVNNIRERQERLTENNLIFATNIQVTRDTRENLTDNNFSILRGKVETAGNLLAGISNISGFKKNEAGNYEILGVGFSQYVKFEGEYIKHWLVGRNDKVAVRAFGGIAIPYNNSRTIPFTRSYFAGGANDNRGWRAYDLGPGSSGGLNEFNEANFKLAFNAEYRYTILGAFKGAFFVDAGNIWNALDNVRDPASKFEGIADLKEIAVASGIGLRYDFGFFVLRFDVGFKTHNPGNEVGNRWFNEYNLKKAVYNIGINYPF